jgi:ABC-type Fe3+ transport system permease subunit
MSSRHRPAVQAQGPLREVVSVPLIWLVAYFFFGLLGGVAIPAIFPIDELSLAARPVELAIEPLSSMLSSMWHGALAGAAYFVGSYFLIQRAFRTEALIKRDAILIACVVAGFVGFALVRVSYYVSHGLGA